MTARIRGTPGAPGIAIGPAWWYAPPAAPGPAGGPASSDTAADIRAAAGEAARQLEALAQRTRDAGRVDDAGIFEAQAMMATDPLLVDGATRRAAEGEPVAIAVELAAADAAASLERLDDPLLAARAADVRDVGARIRRILTGEVLALPEEPVVVLADDLPPSVTAEIPAGFLLGVGLARGSKTAHAVILARSLDIPCVVGLADLVAAVGVARQAAGGDEPVVALDGDAGELVLDPGPADQSEFERRRETLRAARTAAASLRDRPCATADGERVLLVANIGRPEDARRALDARAEGVGLFRTEFLFMRRQTAADEQDQVEAYRQVLDAFGPDRPVVIRLADIGGDKDIPYLHLAPEANPFLGVRAIRLAYGSRGLLLTQLRALWRAGAASRLTPRVMAPMVATVADVDLLCSLRDEARESLLAEGLPCAKRMITGIMIEVPSAAILAAELARRVDFFSIGTNDLTQYLLAADRGNAALGRLQDALHPAVLRTIAGVVAGADAAGIPVAVCGELAGDPAGALVLVGLGVDELSADAGSLDGVRTALAGVTRSDLDQLAGAALAASDAETVRALAARFLAR